MEKDFKRAFAARANAARKEIYDIAAVSRAVVINSVAAAGGDLALDPARETHAWVGECEYVTRINADNDGGITVYAKSDCGDTVRRLDGMEELDIIAIAEHLVLAGYDIGGEPSVAE